jgi:hypothetical protein
MNQIVRIFQVPRPPAQLCCAQPHEGGAAPAKPGSGELRSPPGAFWGGIVKNQQGLDSEALHTGMGESTFTA